MKLRIVQHFFGDTRFENGDRTCLPPACEAPSGCITRAHSFYADENLKGVALCAKHEDELAASITTCGARFVTPPRVINGKTVSYGPNGKICTLAKDHISDHQYHVDGHIEWTWK